jgi:tRNA(adenine34) deaminase
MNIKDEFFLRQAIALAHQARQAGERPFGAVKAQDQCRTLNDPTAHAELRLISSYCNKSKRFDLTDITIYSCAEPCIMCSGAIKWSGISRVVFGVPQAILQKVSGGRLKPTCEELVNTGVRHIEVLGSLLLDEALTCFEGFNFALHRQDLLQKQE